MPDFEAFLVPVYHLELLRQALYVSVDVGDLNLGAPHDKAARQVQRWLVALLDELKVPIEGIRETLIYVTR